MKKNLDGSTLMHFSSLLTRLFSCSRALALAVLLGASFLFPINVFAINCNAVFDAGIKTHGNGSEDDVNFACDAKLVNNPTNVLQTKIVVVEGAACDPTCSTTNCSATGSLVPNIDAGSFQSTSDPTDFTVSSGTRTIGSGGDYQDLTYDNITVRNSGTLTFITPNQTYKIDRLRIQNSGTVNFVAGDYWIERLDLRNDATINVVGGGTARIFTADSTDSDADDNVRINVGGGAHKLFLYSYGVIEIRENAQVEAVVYGQEGIILSGNATFKGVGTANTIDINAGTTMTYDPNAISNIDFGAFVTSKCGGGNCAASFPKALQNHDDNSKDSFIPPYLTFGCSGRVANSTDNILATNNLNNSVSTCDLTCGTLNCVASSIAPTYDIGSFQNHSGNVDLNIGAGQTATIGAGGQDNYDEILVGNDATINFTDHGPNTVYKIDKLDVERRVTMNMVPGTYWIDDFDINNDSKINIVGDGTVILITKVSMTYQDRVEINYNSGKANASQYFFHYGRSKIKFDNDAKAEGFFYSRGQVELDAGVQLTGAVYGDNVDLDGGAVITFDSTAATALDVPLNNFCTGTPTVAIDHFLLSHATNGVFCVGENVIVTAKDVNNNTVDDYAGTIVLDTGTGKGDWSKISGNGAFSNGSSNDGIATYTFDDSDNGVATFNLSYTEGAATVDIEVFDQSDTNIRDDETVGPITFLPRGLLMTDSAIPANPSGTPASYAVAQTAGISDTVHLTAYGQLPFGACGVIESYAGNKDLKFWMDYINPNSGTKVINVNSAGVGTSEAGAQTVSNINFTAGRATVSSIYRDVGSVKLRVKDDSGASTLYGSTNNYVVKPAQFIVSIPALPSPVPTDHTGGVLAKAGAPFSVRVTVQDNDGNITPNYGNENAGIEIFSSSLVSPVGGRNGSQNDGAISNNDVFSKVSPGVFEGATFSFDEVGIIKLTAQVDGQDYLGAGNVSGPESGNVGRFTPDHFALTPNIPDFNSACSSGGFTYLGQNFLYGSSPQIDVIAQAVANTTTQNYTGDYWKITNLTVLPTYTSNSAIAALDASAAEHPSIVGVNENGDGTGTIGLGDGGGIRFDRPIGIDAPSFFAEMQLSVDVQDADSVVATGNPLVFGGTAPSTGITFSGGAVTNNEFLQGRVYVGNGSGSELMALTMPFEVQYYDGTSYVTNVRDNCTVFSDPMNIYLTPDPVSLNTNAGVSTFVNGVGGLTLSTPTGTTVGEVNVEVDLSTATGANLPHLQYDWPFDGNADGVTDDNPNATAAFGIFSGEDNIIYLREVWE